MGEIVVYKLGQVGEQESASIVGAHYFHAQNQGRVLFTVPEQNNTKIGKGHDLSQIIVTTAYGEPAFIGSLETGGYGIFPDEPDSAYTSPSQFDVNQEMDEGYVWFAIDQIEKLTPARLADYVNSNTKKPLMRSISGASCRIYVEEGH